VQRPLLSLVALPFTSGYYSKETILLSAINGPLVALVRVILFIGAVFTIVYRFRLMNTLGVVRSGFVFNPLFEDFGSLLSGVFVLILSLTMGFTMSLSGFDLFILSWPTLIVTLQALVILFMRGY
jgi:NADH:ubiquinone oxidoreductase subunit 5 (subunit L)/multisubunit Na+/H+ antiporter MnhA subunit